MNRNNKPTVAQLSLVDGGSSYAIRLRDGSFILLDGGLAGDDYDYNSRELWRYLSENTPDGERPVIADWIITHFHPDHVDLAARFLTEYKDRITVRSFRYNHPGHTDAVRCPEEEMLWQDAMNLYPEAERQLLATGEVLEYPGVIARVLLTEADKNPEGPENQNEISAALRFKFDTGAAFLALGDISPRRMTLLLDREYPTYTAPEELRCEVVWVAHHGFSNDPPEYMKRSEEFYRTVKPRIALYSMCEYDFLNDKRMIRKENGDNRYLRHGECDCYHHGKTTIIDMEEIKVISENRHEHPYDKGHIYNSPEELIAALGGQEMPEDFSTDFLATVVEFETHGAPYLEESYLNEIENEFHIFDDKLEFVRDAQRLVRENETAALYSLIAKKMIDRASGGKHPTLPDLTNVPESDALAYEMAPYFATFAFAGRIATELRAKQVPEDVIKATLRQACYETLLVCNRRRGRDGFTVSSHYNWNVHFIELEIIRVGVLNFEMREGFSKYTRVFRNTEGKYCFLVNNQVLSREGQIAECPGCEAYINAQIVENETHIEGYAIDTYRAVSTLEHVSLDKSEWREVIGECDKVINVHIPASKEFNPSTIAASYKRVREIFARSFPDYKDAPFVCTSWLMSPDLPALLKPESNIVAFQSQYMRFPVKASGKAVFTFLFDKPGNENIEEMPEDTSLRRKVKELYRAGGYVHESSGIFFPEDYGY